MKLGRGALVTLFAALALLVPAYIGSFSSGVPTVFSPFPALTIIPALLLAQAHFGVRRRVTTIATLSAMESSALSLFREEGKIPKSYVLFVSVAALSVVDFVMSWKLGLHYQGPRYTAIICSLNIVWAGLLGLAFLRCLKTTPSFRTSLFLHWMLFAWLCWYAFPWLRELI